MSVNPPPPVSFARIVMETPIRAIHEEVQGLLRQNWIAHVNHRDYTGDWDVLPLRCQRQHITAHPVLQGFAVETGDEWEYLPVLDNCPTLRKFLHSFPCSLKAVRLMRLKAGAEIKPHRDQGLCIEQGEARLHLPIQTSGGVTFTVNEKPVSMDAGELWYLNADQVHAVSNRGSEDRINLVIDCEANDWLRGEISRSNHR